LGVADQVGGSTARRCPRNDTTRTERAGEVGMDVSPCEADTQVFSEYSGIRQVKRKFAGVEVCAVNTILGKENIAQVKVFQAYRHRLFSADLVETGKVRYRHIIDNLAKPWRVG